MDKKNKESAPSPKQIHNMYTRGTENQRDERLNQPSMLQSRWSGFSNKIPKSQVWEMSCRLRRKEIILRKRKICFFFR